MHTPKKVYELFILYDYLQYSHLHFTVSKTETGTDETHHLYICSSSSDPWDQCFAPGSWGDWTSNVGSVLGLHPMGHVCRKTLMEWTLQDWDAQQFFCT